MEDYKPDTVFAIAIRNPASGIEGTIADEIARRPTFSNPQTVRYGNQLAVVSYTQVRGEMESRDKEHLYEFLASTELDYIVLPGASVSREPIDQILLEGMGYIAARLMDYHQEQAAAGELPKPFTDYQMQITVCETPGDRPRELAEFVDDSSPLESHDGQYEFPLSKIVVGKELDRIKAGTGIITGVRFPDPDSYAGMSEQTARVLIRRIAKYREETSI